MQKDDSSDSEAERERQEQEELERLEALQAQPVEFEIPDEEILKLVTFVKQITTLYDLRASDWTIETEVVIASWFRRPWEPALCVYFADEFLKAKIGFPNVPVHDLMYFLREKDCLFTVENFHEDVTFGSINTNVEGSLLKILENIYAPIFFDIQSWPENVKAEFCSAFHKFLAKLTELHYKLLGMTVLYVPLEGVGIDVIQASTNKDLIKRLDSVVVYWTRQIRLCLSDQESAMSQHQSGPYDEYELWIYRYENLVGINYQLQNKNLLHIQEVLLTAESSYIKQFVALSDEISQSVNEAKKNIEYLQILRRPCFHLDDIENPDEIHIIIPDFLHLFRVIWMNSPYFNTSERITSLCRALSNQVISRCKVFADLDGLLEGRSTSGTNQMKRMIAACEDYKRIYYEIKEVHNNDKPGSWELDEKTIFSNLESFIQRCSDLIEICHCMRTIGRQDETENIPKPIFGGSRGEEFEKVCEKVEKMFSEALRKLIAVKHTIFDTQAASWYTDFNAFRQTMKEIDVIIENLVTDIFNTVSHVEEALDALCALYNYTKREGLKGLFERKTAQVWEFFLQELQDAKNDLIMEREVYPSIFPYFAGRAISARQHKLRLVYLKELIERAEWMWLCPIAHDVEDMYKKLTASIDERVKDLYCKWIDDVGEDLAARLEKHLMNRSLTHVGLLECNIDRSVLNICNEAKYWESMGFEIPNYIKTVYAKFDNIKFIFESVVSVVRDYNKIIASLSTAERYLFKQLIGSCEKKILPGLLKLTYISEVADTYIAECVTHTGEAFLDDYKVSNLEIVKIAEKICDTPLFHIIPNYAYELKEFQKALHDYKHNTIIKILMMFREIMNYLIVVYEGFEEYLHMMVDQWITYVQRFDVLIEEALKICVKNSLTIVYNALHGEGNLGPSPLIKLSINLTDNKIQFKPSVMHVGMVLSNILPSVIDTIALLPRLCKKFNVPSDMPGFHQIIAADEDCLKMQAQIEYEMSLTVDAIQNYLTRWKPYSDMWEINKDLFIKKYETYNPSALTFDSNIMKYSEIASNVQMEETHTVICFTTINSSNLKKKIVNHCIEWQKKLQDLLCKMTDIRVNKIYDYTKNNANLLLERPQNLKQLGAICRLYIKVDSEIPTIEAEFPIIEEQFNVLDKYEVAIPPQLDALQVNMPNRWEWYLSVVEQCRKMIEFSKDTFKEGLLHQAEAFKKDSEKFYDRFTKTGPFSADLSVGDAKKNLKRLRAQLLAMRNREANLKEDLGVFNISQPESEALMKLEADLEAIELVWQLTEEWENAWETYKKGDFWTIQTQEMEIFAQQLFRKLTRLSRELQQKNWEIVDKTRLKVDAFRRTLPLLTDLKNPAMRERHWDRVRKVTNKEFDQKSPDFKLELIVSMNFQEYSDDINDISIAATMELQIEQGLKAISDMWAIITIEMVPYKDKGIYRLKGVDECFQALEEHAVSLSTMKATRFVEPFAQVVDYWERTLSYIGETLENILLVQRQWLYLENIFMGEDIRKQLPKETTIFDKLTHEWQTITYTMNEMKTAVKATHYEPPPYLLDTSFRLNDTLEDLQRALEKYLETKRRIFPRFYFISNDDLLEILGNSKKPDAVQPHFKKLFDNINKMKLGKSFAGKNEAYGMLAEDGEYVEFANPTSLEGTVEYWLNDIERDMRDNLKSLLKNTRTSLRKNLNKRDQWLFMWPGQLCLTASQIQWTSDCTRTLIICKITSDKKNLKKLRKKQNRVLMKLSEMSRSDLGTILRLKVNSLITIEIHARDVIDRMYKTNCMDVNDFEWFSQLRFYWDRESDLCMIRQTNTISWYNYEYTGNSGRLVITPLTDRCYITLTTALHLFRGGSPKGPAGTGKTETVKDLGKALGMWVIVTNCSEGLDYKSMGKCFSGLSQTGAWGCFDEFNRINIEVLSVVSQQILSVLTALSQGLFRFVFEGDDISLVHTVGLFITMNPGYAGRTELPDNLKSMFRPISMMVPDTCIIADNTLFSDGFITSRILAKKVFTLYQLATQQLSKQDHYDFGLRSMVALLRYAGRKRRAYPHYPEEEILYLAMKDMNIAKLTSDDLPLFNGIMSDIFPGVQIPVVDYEDFNNYCEKELEFQGLQKIPITYVKVIQLFETKVSRHSVMLVGATGTAKSVTWKVLKGTLIRMKKAGIPGFVEAQEYPLNPKSLSLGEIYGEYNLTTNEWLDGVLSAIMRKVCSDESPDQKWILFDGPVDAVWIENMNSVMDDNKLLTLINSERITMPAQVSLLFEVGDLSVASPATVSRCGMVYNDYKDWGWTPFFKSWCDRQKDKKFYVPEVKELFYRHLDTILNFKRLRCKEVCDTAEISNVSALCKLLDIFATKENGMDPTDPDAFSQMCKLWWFFCCIWSVCATVDSDGRKKLDTLLRELEGIFPIKDTIYEYFVDPRNKAFISWDEKLNENWKYVAGAPFYKIIVPTVDTVRYEYLVSHLLSAQASAMLVGPIGTGKTSTAQSVTDTLDSMKYSLLAINMSAQTTSNNVQDIIESRVEKRTKGVYVPIGGKTMIVFMDDFNMPAKETYGSQPPLELIRTWIDYGFWYDRLKQTKTTIKDILLMAAMGPPGGGRNVISPRLLSKFCTINMTFPSEAQISRIFGTMLNQQLTDFDEETKTTGKTITMASIDVYHNVILKMLPTPAKMHYLFNLRDISRIFQGLLRSHKDYHNTKPTILRLWVHECFRVFNDRLTDERDQQWFREHMGEQLGKHFDVTFASLCPSKEPPVFADFVNPFMIYEDILDFNALRKYVELQMVEYNASPGVVRVDIVLFKDALEHITRIERVISQPRGHCLLVGIGGSGRQSLSRIAAYISELNTFQIEVTKTYDVGEFKEDLKILYVTCGVEFRPTSFLFNDTQIAVETFLEIINNMLSTGEVANLFKADEFEEIKNNLHQAVVRNNITQTSEAIYLFLIERVRTNLHIVLCMSPIGDSFRNRLRQYPSLINCCTIDWFHQWPKVALLEVANKYLSVIDFIATITGEKPVIRQESLVFGTQERLRIGVAQAFSTIHDSVAQTSDRMLNEMKRHNYVTPTNYLELVAGYRIMLESKRRDTAASANKLRNGLFKIDDTRVKVQDMTVELEVAQVQVAEFQKQCDEYLVVIVEQTEEADEQKKSVAEKRVKIEAEEVICKEMAIVAQADLDEAMPALESAMAALDSLNKKDMTEIKSYSQPPKKVEMVLEAVMILKEKPPTWTEAKRQLGNQDFLDQLRNFDRNHISDKTLKKIAVYTSNDDFEPEKVGMVSIAAKSLCLWVIAIEKYGYVWKVVGPKQAKLDETMESLRQKQAMLAEAQAKLDELNAKLGKLQEEYNEKLHQKEELALRAKMLLMKLDRAVMLIDGLAGEKARWEVTVESLDGLFNNLPGDCLIATAYVSYMGPFVSQYREDLMDCWKNEITEQNIPASENFSIEEFLCDPTTIREWNIQGLPSDAFSTENGIIIVRGSRWPLVIDPQCQAAKWIKAMEAKNDLKVIDFGQRDFMRVLEVAVQLGKSVLLQNVQEVLDPAVTPILNKAIIRQGNQLLIKLSDKQVEYNENFKFFITTKLSNPHYAPEVSTKTTLVNFAIKEQGLEGQLLGVIICKEKPQLEEQKNNLVLNIARNKRMLIDLENEILRLLNESRGSLLDDEELFATLQTSKKTSIEANQALLVAEVTEVEIDYAREGYRPCAKRASILFFILMDMSKIDPMYQFSLDSYILLFDNSIDRSPRSSILSDRIINLNEYHTYSVYKNTCRGLFEIHKLLFSFHMCIKILTAADSINFTEYNFLLKGGVVLDRETQMDNPCLDWMPDVAWDNITELDKLPGFHGVADAFETTGRDWKEWYINTEPETLPLVGDYEEQCNDFQKMLFVRSLRSDRLSFSIASYVVNTLGAKYVEPPVLDIRAVVEESVPRTPLIFVLSPGVDPTSALLQLADAYEMLPKFHSLSLGQGQAPIATRMIGAGMKEGHWVFLANCHLSLTWMPKLDKIIENLQVGKPNPDFRLWLSSSPNPEFPISILQAGIKMTTEPPKGIKANLKRIYQNITDEQFSACKSREKYKRLLFALCFFHAVLLERKKFQQLGWNVVYSFNDSDFEVSENLLSIYLDEYTDTTPWDALKYLIAGVNYGGHVTDDWDRRLLLTYVNQYFCEDSIQVPMCRLSSLPTYFIPRDGSLESYQDILNILPNVDRPEAFGQHTNADITSLINETRNLCEILMSMQVQSGAGEGESKEDKVSQLAQDVLTKVPEVIDYETTDKLIGHFKTPLDVVLLQEISRYNILLREIKSSLVELQKGIKGLVVMSTELENVFTCMFEGRVPEKWLKAYPSQKLLGSWTRDLGLRVDHFSKWAETVKPPILFWLAAYTFPTGFLTAVLQTSARMTNTPIDQLGWDFTVFVTDESTVGEAAPEGVYVRGTYLEGGGWNIKNQCLVEPEPMQLVCAMPLIHFKPVEQLRKRTRGLYNCPTYYYPNRAGLMGRPAYVVAVDLKVGSETSDFWVKRGTALLLSLAN